MIKIQQYTIQPSKNKLNIEVFDTHWVTCKDGNAFYERGEVYEKQGVKRYYNTPALAVKAVFEQIQRDEFNEYDSLEDFVLAMTELSENIVEACMGADI